MLQRSLKKGAASEGARAKKTHGQAERGMVDDCTIAVAVELVIRDGAIV